MCWASGRGGIFGYAVRQTRDTVSGPYARPMQPRVDGDAARGLPTRWRVALDVVPGVALGGLAGLAGLTSSEYPNPGPVTAILVCAAGLMLVLRRTQPTVAFVGSMGLMTLVSLVFGSYQAGTAVLIGLVASYSALSWGVPLPVFVGVLALYAGGEAWGEPLPEALGGAVFVVGVLGLAGAGGYLTRRLRELTAANIALRELVQRESAATAQAAVRDERARVARELHDILSHSLGVVVLQTSAAEHAWTADPEHAREALHSARETAVEAVEQLRTLLDVVREDPSSGRSPVPSIADLPALAQRTTSAGFEIDMAVLGEPRPVPAAVQASVYRVAQEGIANAMKHSGAHSARLQVAYEPDCVVVSVDDDGGTPRGAAGSRVGLVGIRERATVFGGRVEAGPRDSGGWRLQVAFPT